jgi:hypothetical protein
MNSSANLLTGSNKAFIVYSLNLSSLLFSILAISANSLGVN